MRPWVDEIEIGEHQIKRTRSAWRHDDPGTLYYAPQSGILVQGDDVLLRPVIEGTHKGGVPAPALMRATAGADNLAFFATHLNDAMRNDMPPGTADWPVADDPVTFVMMRLRTTGTEDDPELALEGLLQCERGTTGPEHLEKKSAKDSRRCRTTASSVR